MNPHEDDTPGGANGPSEMDRDVLAQRRARRGVEASGDPILVRRAETAEAAAHALEERLTRIQARLQDAEQECSNASERLGQRERELRLASERLASGEQELHAVTGRLAGRENDLRLVSERLREREEQLQVVSDRLVVREQELRKAELEIKGRLEELEGRIEEVQRELASERGAREIAERELAEVRAALGRTTSLVSDLRGIAGRLRTAVEAAGASGDALSADYERERERRAQMSEALASAVERLRTRVAAVGELQEQRMGAAESAEAATEEPAATDEAAETEALAATVESVVKEDAAVTAEPPATDGVAATAEPAATVEPEAAEDVGATEEPFATNGAAAIEEPTAAEIVMPVEAGAAERAHAGQQASSQWIAYIPPAASPASDHKPWLAQAIRRVAEHRDARLAAELVVELLPVQASRLTSRLRYSARIAELGDYEVTVGGGHASVVRDGDGSAPDPPDFILTGPAASFAEIAAGGASKRPAGLRVRGRLRARRLIAARREPIVLADLADAGVVVWPGLLLLAMVEAIDPAWTSSQRFTIAFEVQGAHNATLHLEVRDGQPLSLVRAPVAAGAGSVDAAAGASVAPRRAATGDESEVAVTVRASERAFGCMLAGVALPAREQVLVSGDVEALTRTLRWMDRVQGIRRFGD